MTTTSDKMHALRFAVESLTSDPWGESTLARFKWRNEQIYRLFPCLITPLARPVGLDLGCGTGTLAARLSSYYQVLTCVDADRRSVEKLKNGYPALHAHCLELPVLPQLTDIDVATCFGAVYYLTNDQLAALCRTLLSGVLHADGLWVVDNLDSERQRIIERHGFRLVRVVNYRRPKHKLSLFSRLRLQAEFLKALITHGEDDAVRAFLELTRHRSVKAMCRIRVPLARRLLSATLSATSLLAGLVARSVLLYRLCFLFGVERAEILVFKRSEDEEAKNNRLREQCEQE